MLEFVRVTVTTGRFREGRIVSLPPHAAVRMVERGQAEYLPTTEVLVDGSDAGS